MYYETILPDERQEQVEQIIRDVIAGMGDEEGRFIPSPDLDSELEIPRVPNLSSIQVRSFEDQNRLSMNLYFSGTPKGDAQIVGDQVPAEISTEDRSGRDSAEPTWLGDLGGPHKELSDDMIKTLTAYLDTPQQNREKWFLGERADFLCTIHRPDDDFTHFSTVLKYPQFIETVYAEGRRDVAEHLRLPF